MRGCCVAAPLAILLASATLITLLFINIAEKMAPGDFPDDLMKLPPFPANNSLLFDLTNFSYLIEPPDCSNESQLAILLVTSHYEHVELRSAHRRGYPEELLTNVGIRRVFLLALPPSKTGWQQGAVEDEARRFKDILQGNFIEAYRHLTYKNTMGLLWAARKCSNATFIAKIDDDIAVNVFELVKVMREERYRGPTRLAGNVIAGTKPIRNPGLKWFLTKEEFAEETFPDYLSGWLFFGPTGLLGRLAHNASATMPYVFIDDVLLLGVVREKMLGKSSFLALNSRFSADVNTVRCCLVKPKVACHFIAGPVDQDDRLLLRFIRHAIKCSKPEACQLPLTDLAGCATDVRALIEDALSSVDESSTGVASPVPL